MKLIIFSLQILRYLINQEDIRINTRNFLGQTALFLAVRSGHFESAKILIENGANVNLPDNEEVTSLHKSVQYPDIAHMLIKNGANVNAVDYSDDTPLHDAVADNCLETVCMLLYYNADANALGGNNLTPFMKALITENFEIQDALFNYVDDYAVTTLDYCSTLTLALTHDNPYVEEIIKRGAEVNVAAYKACINIPNANNFKLIWSHLAIEDVIDDDVNLMLLFYELDKEDFDHYIEIIIENSDSSVLEILAQKTTSKDLSSLIEKCANNFLTHEQITKLTLLWLEYGFEMGSDLIVEVFANMGYCELFKILLFMDFVENWSPFSITPRIICDIQSDITTRCNELIKEGYALINLRKFRKDVINSLHYWNNRQLVEIALNQFGDTTRYFEHEETKFKKYFDLLPAVPSLLELARDQTRKYIVSKLKFNKPSQYYTWIHCLDISIVYKRILLFEKKIYS